MTEAYSERESRIRTICRRGFHLSREDGEFLLRLLDFAREPTDADLNRKANIDFSGDPAKVVERMNQETAEASAQLATGRWPNGLPTTVDEVRQAEEWLAANPVELPPGLRDPTAILGRAEKRRVKEAEGEKDLAALIATLRSVALDLESGAGSLRKFGAPHSVQIAAEASERAKALETVASILEGSSPQFCPPPFHHFKAIHQPGTPDEPDQLFSVCDCGKEDESDD